ncbi:hypothetical protein KSS87_003980, partial [Heliosperma pusillum]
GYIFVQSSDQLSNYSLPDSDDVAYETLDGDAVAMKEESPLMDEEAALMDLLTFIYSGTKYHEEVMNLPLAGIEAVLCSDQLQVASEDAVYDFAVKWARTHYLDLEERREVLGTRLCKLIRFPPSRLTVNGALLADVTNTSTNINFCRYIQRAYKYRPVKVVEFETPRQQSVVYLDLRKEQCQNLYPSGRVYSQAFHLGGQGCFLSAHCNLDQQSSFHCFGLFLGMQEKGSVTFTVEYEFGARQKTSDDYMSRYRGNYTFMGGKAVGYRNLFGVSWTSFMADDCPFFVNDILHLRAELTIKQ